MVIFRMKTNPEPLARLLSFYAPVIGVVTLMLLVGVLGDVLPRMLAASIESFFCGFCAARMIGVRSEEYGDRALAVGAGIAIVFGFFVLGFGTIANAALQ